MPLPPARTGNLQAFQLHVYPPSQTEWTLGDPETVTWSAVRHLTAKSDATEVASKRHGIASDSDCREIAENVKLYIRQASDFYQAAKASGPNTAPLQYYYSFLHLAKALCEFKRPRFHECQECYRHGVTWKPSPGALADPKTSWVALSGKGIWQALWESLTGKQFPLASPSQLPIKDLFCYCPEIAVEVQTAFGHEPHLLQLADGRVLTDLDSSETWVRFSIPASHLVSLNWSAADLIRQISTPGPGYMEIEPAKADQRTFESAIPVKLGHPPHRPTDLAIRGGAVQPRHGGTDWFVLSQIRQRTPSSHHRSRQRVSTASSQNPDPNHRHQQRTDRKAANCKQRPLRPAASVKLRSF